MPVGKKIGKVPRKPGRVVECEANSAPCEEERERRLGRIVIDCSTVYETLGKIKALQESQLFWEWVCLSSPATLSWAKINHRK